MKTNPKLSVIITSYNVQNYIAEAIDSILAQSLGDMEVIIVDDGSTDETPSIIKNYAELDDRIKPILFADNTIGGVASAANAGLEVATGDYIGFADGDDVYDSEMFGKLYRAAVKNDSDLAMCQFMLQNAITGERVESDDKKNWSDIETITSFDLDDSKKKKILSFSPVPWRKIYRGDMVRSRALRFPVGDYFFEDNPFHWASVLSAKSIVLLPEILCYHRMERPGQTMSNVGPSLFKLFHHHDNIRKWINGNGYKSFEPLLIEWVAKQNAWISEKASEKDLPLLFAEIKTIADQYSDEQIGRLPFSKDGRTYKMLTAAKNSSLAEFSQFAHASKGKSTAAKSKAQASSTSSRVDLEDIYFALMLINKRISGLEEKLDAVAAKKRDDFSEPVSSLDERQNRGVVGSFLRRVKAF